LLCPSVGCCGQPGVKAGGRKLELLPWVLTPDKLCLGRGCKSKEDCKTSAALRSARLLLSADSRFYQEMSVRKKWSSETRGAWNSSPPLSKHSFV